jgi:ATP-binding cassette subfamily B (MDR/TAP) protein 1
MPQKWSMHISFFSAFPAGYNTNVGEDGFYNVSVGYSQLCRGLISACRISIEAFFICFAASIFGQQSGVFSFAPDMGKSQQAASSLKILFDRIPEIDVWSTAGEKVEGGKVQGALDFRDVQFSYPTRKAHQVLRGINLKFAPEQNVALVGPSGCGKSTIIALAERFYDPSSGQVLLDGRM